MVFEFFRRGRDTRLEDVEQRIAGMLLDCRHAFELAYDALLDGADPMTVGPEVRTTDRRVNITEGEVRKALLVHVSVRGARANLPAVLASMSVAKDAERIGDYAKNVWDLAAHGVDFSTATDRDALQRWRDRVAAAIGEVATVFVEHDAGTARALINEFDGVLDEFDDLITSQLASTEPSRHAVPRALLFRYLKRVVAHLMNILTSLVMPLDRLDFYDEDKADRV